MKRRNRHGKSGSPIAQGSKFERWFAARTNPPSRGMCSSPVAFGRKSSFITGSEAMPTT
jgi:hypothetical protein